MKIRKMIFACLIVAFASIASAAPITWSDPIPNALPDTTGDLVEAVNVGGVAVTAGGIDFADGYLTASDSMYANFVTAFPSCWDNGWGSAANDTGDAGLNELLRGHRWTGNTTAVLTLSNLTVGIPYQIQLYMTDDRGCCNTRSYIYSDGLGNDSAVWTRGSDVSFIGSFVADTDTQEIQTVVQAGSDPGLCAYVLRDLSGMAFDPAPRDGQDEVPVNVTLEWNTMLVEDPADPNARIVNPDLVRHEVYLSNGDPADPNVTSLGQVAAGDPVAATASYGPLSLNRDSTYFWRVDEIVTDANSNEVTIEGALWSFITVPSDPIINAGPETQFVDADETVSVDFVVEAINPFYPNGTLTSETDGLAYQWQFDDGSGFVDLTGETSATLTVTTDTGDGHEGTYQCVVSITDNGTGGAGGTALSGTAALIYEKLIGHWPFDGDTNDTVGTNNGTTAITEYIPGQIGQAIRFRGGGGNPDETEGTAVKIMTAAHDTGFLNFTLSWWEKTEPNAAVDNWDTMVTLGAGTMQAVLYTGDYFYGTYYGGGYIYVDNIAKFTDRVYDFTGRGQWHFHALTFDGDEFVRYVDGVRVNGTDSDYNFTAMPDTMWVGNQDDANGTFNNGADTAIDELKFYNYAMEADDVAGEYIGIKGGKICQNIPAMDRSGPEGTKDCKVDIYDLLEVVGAWLDHGFYPEMP